MSFLYSKLNPATELAPRGKIVRNLHRAKVKSPRVTKARKFSIEPQSPSAGWTTFAILERVFETAQKGLGATQARAGTSNFGAKRFGARSVQKSPSDRAKPW